MLLLQVSDFLINEQHDTRLREAGTDRLARLARAVRPEPRTPVRKDPGLGRGPRLATRVLHLFGRSAGA